MRVDDPPNIPEGSILLASLIGHLKATDGEDTYQFEHRMIAGGVDFSVYQNYFRKRQDNARLHSSLGYDFEAISDPKPLANGQGFTMTLRPKL